MSNNGIENITEPITYEIICDYLKCEYKAYQKYKQISGIKHDLEIVEQKLYSKFRDNYFAEKKKTIPNEKILYECEIIENIQFGAFFIENPFIKTSKYFIQFDAIETKKTDTKSFLPIIISSKEKISKEDKLALCISIIIANKVAKLSIENGAIVHGKFLTKNTFSINTFKKEAQHLLEKIISNCILSPVFHKNKNCNSCEYNEICIKQLIEKDDLSLLGGFSKQNIIDKNNRGIFTIFQFSHTYSAKRLKSAMKKKGYYPELKALALREKKTYIMEIPEIRKSNVEIFLDFESLPDENFVYLIGMIVRKDNAVKKMNFWADSVEQEEDIFKSFFKFVGDCEKYKIFHYGKYEISELEKFNKKHNDKYKEEISKIKSHSIDIYSFFVSFIYPPVYSNSLKEIANYLGYKWSRKNVSGLHAIAWRKSWEIGDIENKVKIIRYNLEDCEALIYILNWFKKLKIRLKNKSNKDVEQIGSRVVKTSHRFEKPDYANQELEEINKFAYFDYQRTKIFFKTNKKIEKSIKLSKSKETNLNKPNKQINIIPCICPFCKGKNLKVYKGKSKIKLDLKLMQSGIKKWIVKYRSGTIQCKTCNKLFTPKKYKRIEYYGDTLLNWVMFQYIIYKISYEQLVDILLISFHIKVSLTELYGFKDRLAKKYNYTYNEIKRNIFNGSLVHADETKANVRDKPLGYVWVFTNMTLVYYLFKPNRKTDFLIELMQDFKGVLVSDFYAGYDKIDCTQQKCLIHLIRDLNEDLFKYPANQEYKNIVSTFGTLLQKTMNTINEHGLKQEYLKHHKQEVQEFFAKINDSQYKTEIANKYKKRFDKNKDKLFTFLDYDSVPWNNNNAEHSIKPYAKYRRNVKNQITSTGIKGYLILLSIYQSCVYQGIDFMKFLQSGDKSLIKHYKDNYAND